MPTKIKLSEALAEWVQQMEAQRKAPSTVRSRHQGMKMFMKSSGDILVSNITHQHVTQVFADYSTWAPATCRQRLSQYKTFFMFCRLRKYMARDYDPTIGWRFKVPETERLWIPTTKWEALFNACYHPTETMVIAAGLYLFLRVSEMKTLLIGHVNVEADEVAILRQKTGQFDSMPICLELRELLLPYMVWLTAQGATSQSPLIPARSMALDKNDRQQFVLGSGGVQLTHCMRNPEVAVQRVLARCGYSTLWNGGHTLRRSGARAYFDSLVEEGYDGALRRVQTCLGHANAAMTERYLGLQIDRFSRNKDLAGKPMFPRLQGATVVSLREVM